jgi:hypothetical protein
MFRASAHRCTRRQAHRLHSGDAHFASRRYLYCTTSLLSRHYLLCPLGSKSRPTRPSWPGARRRAGACAGEHGQLCSPSCKRPTALGPCSPPKPQSARGPGTRRRRWRGMPAVAGGRRWRTACRGAGWSGARTWSCRRVRCRCSAHGLWFVSMLTGWVWEGVCGQVCEGRTGTVGGERARTDHDGSRRRLSHDQCTMYDWGAPLIT